MFQEFTHKPYFLASLLQIACDEDTPFGKRHLAVLILKNTIIDTWTSSEMQQEEKDVTLDWLLKNIATDNYRIRSEVCRIIGLTVSYDSPNLHPNLLPALTTHSFTSSNPHQIHGSLLTLTHCVKNCDDRFHKHINQILDPLHTLFTTAHPDFKLAAMNLLTLCLNTWAWMEGVDDLALETALGDMVVAKWVETVMQVAFDRSYVTGGGVPTTTTFNTMRLAFKALNILYSDISCKVPSSNVLALEDALDLLQANISSFVSEHCKSPLMRFF